MANVPISTSYSGLNTPSLSVPTLNAPTLNAPTLNAPTLNVPGLKLRNNPNAIKPNQHIVDLGDIILGDPITGTKQLKDTLKDNGYGNLVYAPILNRIVGLGLSVDERFWHPLAEGKPGIALINTLETAGNSLDLLANPIKSLMPWAGGGTAADFLKSMGWLEDEYRQVYQWDTGNIILDFVGEVISDPTNWATLGGKQVVKELLEASSEDLAHVLYETAKSVWDEAEMVANKELKELDNLKIDLSNINLKIKRTTAELDIVRQESKILDYFTNRTRFRLEDLQEIERVYNIPVSLYLSDKDAYMRALSSYVDINNGNLAALDILTNNTRFKAKELEAFESRYNLPTELYFSDKRAYVSELMKLRSNYNTRSELLSNTIKAETDANKIREQSIEKLSKSVERNKKLAQQGVNVGGFKQRRHTIEGIKSANKFLTKEIFEKLTDSSDDTIRKFIKQLEVDRRVLIDSIKGLPKTSKKYKDVSALLKQYNYVDYLNKHYDIIQAIKQVRNGDLYKKYNTIISVRNASKTIDDAIVAATLATTPATAIGRLLVQYALVPGFDHLRTRYVSALKNADPLKLLNDKAGNLQVSIESIAQDTRVYHAKYWDPFKKLMAKYSINEQNLIKAYTQFIDQYAGYGYNKEQIKQLFAKKFINVYLPALKYIMSDTRVPAQLMDLIEGITPKNIDELLEVIGLNAAIVAQVKETTNEIDLVAVSLDMERFFTSKGKPQPANKLFTDFTTKEQLMYIDKRLLTLDGKYYGLNNLRDFIEHAHLNNPKQLEIVMPILSYLGITVQNSKQVYRLYKAGNLKELKGVLTLQRSSGKLNLNAAQYNKSVPFKLTRTKANIPSALSLNDSTRIMRANIKDGELVYKSAAKSVTTNSIIDRLRINLALDHSVTSFEQALSDGVSTATEAQKMIDDVFADADPEFSLEALDSLNKYVGFDSDLDTTLSKLITGILKFNPDGASIKSLHDFRDDLITLRNQSIILFESLRSGEYDSLPALSRPTEETKRVIEDLYITLRDIDKEQVIIKTNDLINTESSLFRQTLLAQGRYSVIDTLLSASAVSDFIEEVSDVGSELRKHIQSAIKCLVDTSYHYQATAFQNILVRIDNHNALAMLLNTPITSLQLPKVLSNYLQGMLFNTIYNGRDNFLTTYLRQGVDGLVKHYMDNFKYGGRAAFIEWIKENGINKTIEVPDNLVEDLKTLEAKLAINGYLDDVDLTYYDELKAMTKSELESTGYIMSPEEYFETQVMPMVEADIKAAFETYVDTLKNVAIFNGSSPATPVKLYQELDSKTVLEMINLGLDNEQIVSMLKTYNLDDIVVEDIGRFIVGVSGTELDQDLADYAMETIETLYADEIKGFKNTKKKIEDVVEQINNNNKQLVNNSLSKVLRESYIAIDNLVTAIGGGKNVLGKNFINSKFGSRFKTVAAYRDLYLIEQINSFINNTSTFVNTYHWSTSDGLIGFKKEIDARFVQFKKLNSEYIDYNREGTSFMLYKLMQDAEVELNNRVATPNEVDRIRRALINVYKDPTLDFRPKDPENYFGVRYETVDGERVNVGMSNHDILLWDNITRRSSFNRRLATMYYKELNNNQTHLVRTFRERIDYYANPNNVIEDLREVRTKNLISEPKEYVDIYKEVDIDPSFVNDIYSAINADFRQVLKDVDSLKDYEQVFNNRIAQNVDGLNKLKPLDSLKMDKRKIKKVVKDKDALAILSTYGISPDTKLNSKAVAEYLYLERTRSLVESILSWDAQQIRSYIDDVTDGIMVYVDDVGEFAEKFAKENWEEAGIVANKVDLNDVNIYVLHRTEETKPHVDYAYKSLRSLLPDQQNVITKALAGNRHNISWGTMGVPDELFTGALVDGNVYETLKQNKEFSKYIGDAAEQKLYSKIDKNGINTFHTRNNSRPDFTFVGSPSAFNIVTDAFFATADEHVAVNKRTINLIDSVWGGCIESIHRENAVNKYLQLFFNKDYFIGNDVFKPILEKASDEQLKDLFGRLNYKAVVLKESSSGKARAYKLAINNKSDLYNAIENKAIILPHDTYRNLVLTLNRNTVESKLINLYKGTIVGTFKTLYLTSVGFLMRNYIDSAVYKNNASYHGVQGMMDMFLYEHKARKLLEWHDSIQRQVFAISNDQTFNRRNLRKVLANLTREEQELYLVVDMFLNSSASGGLSKSFDEFLLKRNKENTDYVGYQWAKWYNENVLDDPLLNKIRDINNMTEQTSRLGLFLALVEESGDYTKAIKEVINTHFDYALKEPGIELLEQLFWFSTFPINNLMYYVNEGLTKNPSMLKAQMDLIELSYNDGELYTWDDVRKSEYLQRNVIAGNIRFYLLGNNEKDPTARIVIKAGSSVLDFLSIITNPIGEAKERLNPFLSTVLGYDELSQLNPLMTPYNRAKQVITQRNPVPSVFGSLYPSIKQFKEYAPLRTTNYYSEWGASKKYYPYIKTYYQKRYYPQYHKRDYMYSTSVGLKWMRATRGKRVYFYDNNSRIIRAAAKARRAMSKAKMPVYRQTKKETRY